MKTRILITSMTCALVASSLSTLSADVKTTQRATIKFEGMLGRMIGLFGGSDDGKPQTVAVRGDRKAMLSEGHGRIVDLGEEKIFDIDGRRKTYTVTTFDELRQQMKDAEEKAKEDAEEAGEEPSRDPDAPAYELDFAVTETGSKKAIAGHDTRQVVATVTMRQKGKTLETGGGLVLTSDMWLAPRIAALDEIAAFDRRYAEQLYGLSTSMSADQLAALLAMHPGFQDAQRRLAAEGAKLDGTPLMTTLTLESVKNPEAEAREGTSGGSGIGGMAGRLMRRTRDTPGQKHRVFASTSETLSIATSVDDADLAIPDGFKEKR